MRKKLRCSDCSAPLLLYASEIERCRCASFPWSDTRHSPTNSSLALSTRPFRFSSTFPLSFYSFFAFSRLPCPDESCVVLIGICETDSSDVSKFLGLIFLFAYRGNCLSGGGGGVGFLSSLHRPKKIFTGPKKAVTFSRPTAWRWPTAHKTLRGGGWKGGGPQIPILKLMHGKGAA